MVRPAASLRQSLSVARSEPRLPRCPLRLSAQQAATESERRARAVIVRGLAAHPDALLRYAVGPPARYQRLVPATRSVG